MFLLEHFVCFLLLVEYFVLLYFKLLFLFIISGAFCLLYFTLLLLSIIGGS